MPKTTYLSRRRSVEQGIDALESLFGGRATISIEESAQVLGVGRNLAFEMAKNGRLPTLLVGLRRRVVPVAALRKLLENAGKDEA
jgi:excisionase family DNA binding protein